MKGCGDRGDYKNVLFGNICIVQTVYHPTQLSVFQIVFTRAGSLLVTNL